MSKVYPSRFAARFNFGYPETIGIRGILRFVAALLEYLLLFDYHDLIQGTGHCTAVATRLCTTTRS